MNNENRFIKPELKIIEFNNEDIIITSNESGSFGDPDPKPGDIGTGNGWW